MKGGLKKSIFIVSVMIVITILFESCSTGRVITDIPNSTPITEQTKETIKEPTKTIVPSIVPIPINTPINNTPTSTKIVQEVRLSESILQSAIKDSEDKKDWGINLGKIATNYKSGVKISGWIVLHNGDGYENLVTLNFQKTPKQINDSMTNLLYDTTPNDFNPEWVTIGDKVIRLQRMETKAVSVSLLIPDNVSIQKKYWSFYVNADGRPIKTVTQENVVTTESNDHILELKLKQPLLMNDLNSVKLLKSSTIEIPKITRYNANTQILTIEGLKELEKRNLTITYESGEMFTIAYNQIWLLTML